MRDERPNWTLLQYILDVGWSCHARISPNPWSLGRQALIESKVGIRIHAKLVRAWSKRDGEIYVYGDWFMMGSLQMAYENYLEIQTEDM